MGGMWQQIKNIYHLIVAFLAQAWYGFPGNELTIIGVTGTSGKTTTTHMIYHVLKTAGYNVSMLSTIQAIVGGKTYDTGFHVTTPDPHVLPHFLKKAVDNGDKYFVLEVSSHALDQNRAAFIPFRIGVLTTLAHEHLDYHKTFVNYAKAKFMLLHAAQKAVIPHNGVPNEVKDAVEFNKLINKIITFGIDKGDQTQKKWQLKLQIPGDFNIKNALAAATVATLLGVSIKTIKSALALFTAIPGRFEEIKTGKSFRAIIDFAHKPDALEGVLNASRFEVKKNGRIIVMFGCASQRDTLKRPIMGEIAGRLADVTVLTDEDPRYEDPMKIINDIAKGCERAGAKEVPFNSHPELVSGSREMPKQVRHDKENKKNRYFKIPNRKEAIEFVIQKLAKPGDIILLCGKGHEQSMNYKGVEQPWSEQNVVKDALHEKT